MRAIANEVQAIRVLLVEDEFLVSEWVTGSLEEQGFAVHAVTNAADALRHLDAARVDVLFTDINLPGGVDGTTLARRARELLPDLPVVYASAGVNVLDPQVRVPRSTFVPKPYVPALIGRVLANAVKGSAAPLPARNTIARSRRAREILRASGCDNRRQ
jgi:CheY-like chemotaxis protein